MNTCALLTQRIKLISLPKHSLSIILETQLNQRISLRIVRWPAQSTLRIFRKRRPRILDVLRRRRFRWRIRSKYVRRTEYHWDVR